MQTFDYIIVGGGSAASVLAYRLGAANKTVCVLEAGPSDWNPYIRIPAGFMKTLFNPNVTWQLQHQGSPGTNGRPVPVTQGRTLGGSSSVNGAVYNRGQPSDFDGWAQQGNPGWGFADVLPYFRRTEKAVMLGADEYRGRSGRLPVNVVGWRNEACEAFVQGAVGLGLPRNPDYNGEQQAGTGYYQSAIQNNQRWSAARCFLHPARRDFGVRVITNALVTKILFDGRKAVGVAYEGSDSVQREIRAGLSVVISAGTVNTAKLLQLSGIGEPTLLKEHGIEVKHALPGVGENFRDHFSPRLVARAKPGVDSINSRVKGFRFGLEVVNWMLNRPTILAVSPVLAYAFWKSDPALDAPDFAVSFAPASSKQGVLGQLEDFPGLTCGTKQMRPESKGFVRIASANPRDNPVLQPNFLSNEYDRHIAVSALKFARRLLNTPSMKAIVDVETLPGPQVNTDDEWLDFARRYGNSGYHLIGTAKMGPASDKKAVVDAQLKVHGLENLRVADASIMPTMPSANTYAAALMIGEKAADMLLGKFVQGNS